MSSDEVWAKGIRGQIELEISAGGELSHLICPFCGLPRCQRSDYVRCSKCGVNWLDGEDLSRDPKIDRYKAMAESLRSTAKVKGE